MYVNSIARLVAKSIEQIVNRNLDLINISKNFKVNVDDIPGEYFLDKVSGSDKNSLQNLIQNILWYEGIFNQLVKDKKELSLIREVISNKKGEIYKPDVKNAKTSVEEQTLKSLKEKLNEIYFKSFVFTRSLLNQFDHFDDTQFDIEKYIHPMDINLARIRSYTEEHEELMKCHHFLYDLPLNDTFLPDVIVLGINPGETEEPIKLPENIKLDSILEESRQSDFHELYGKGRAKSIWKRKCEEFTGTESLICSEVFFWSSPHPNEKSPKNRFPFCFSERFGYKFNDSPHFNFCTTLNKELIEFYKPKYILMTGVGYHEFVAELFNLEFVEIKTTDYTNKANKKITYKSVIKYMLGDIPFVFTQHISGAQIPKNVKNEIITYLHRLLETG